MAEPTAAPNTVSSSPVSTPSSSPGLTTSGISSAPSGGGSPATDNSGSSLESSMSSTIDSLLAGSSPAGGDDAPDGGQPQQAQPADPSAKPQVEAAGAQAAPDPSPEDEGLEDLDDDTADEAAIADSAKPTNLLDLKQPRGKRIYGAYKQYKAISDTLGRELSVEDAKAHMEAYTDKLLMEHEFSAGDPAAQLNFIQFWNNTNPTAMQGVAAQLPEYLAQVNKDAYNQMALPVVQRYIKHMYTRATQENDPNKQKAMLYMARMADWDLNDSYQSDAQLPKAANPVDAKAQWVEQQLAQLQVGQQQAAQHQRNMWLQQLDSANNSVLDGEISTVLTPLKSTLPGRLYTAAQRDFAEAVREHLAKDVEGERIDQVNRAKSLQRLSSEDIKALSGNYAQRVSRAVRVLAPKLLRELGVQAKTNNTAQHTALAASAAAGKAPNGAGAPVQQSIMPTRGQYASKSDQMEASLNDLLGVRK